MVLFGRERIVADLASAAGPVTVIQADRGVGKSAVLSAAAEREAQGGVLAPRPSQIIVGPGALQRCLLEALTNAAVMAAADQDAAGRIAQIIIESGTRLAKARLADLGKAVCRIVLAQVRDRIGEETFDLAADFAREFIATKDDTVEHRIRALADPDVIVAICELAADVSERLGDRPIHLYLDELELLDTDDLGRLASLTSNLPANVKVRGAFAHTDPETLAGLTKLGQRGVLILPLNGLTETDISEWLKSLGMPVSYSAAVLHLTGGYPFHIVDTIDLLRANKLEEGLTTDQVLVNATQLAWGQLSMSAREAALRLSIFSSRLQVEKISRYLDISQAHWFVIQKELTDARIFLSTGTPWFHELRRNIIVQNYLPGEKVNEFRQLAINELSVELQEHPELGPSLLQQKASITGELISGHGISEPRMIAISKLNYAQLAILAALLELQTSTTEPSGVLGDDLFLHAQDRFAAMGDLPESLQTLAELELVITVEDHNAVAVVPRLDKQEFEFIIGRSITYLPAAPAPAVAAWIFDSVVRPRLGVFLGAQFGIGTPSLSVLSEFVVELHSKIPVDGVLFHGRKFGLILRVGWSQVAFYAAIAFSTSEAAAAARTQFEDLDVRLLGINIHVKQIAKVPGPPVQSRALVNAFETALGIRVGVSHNVGSLVSKVPHSRPADSLQQTTTTLTLLATLSDPFERDVAGLTERSFGGFYDVSEDEQGTSWVEAVVAGWAEVRKISVAPLSMSDPLLQYRLSARANINHEHRLTRWSTNFRSSQASHDVDDPIASEVARYAKALYSYNRGQAHLKVLYDADSIQHSAQEFLDVQLASVTAIAKAFGKAVPLPRDTFVVLDEINQEPISIDGVSMLVEHNAHATIGYMPASGHPTVRVKILDMMSGSLSTDDGANLARNAMRDRFDEIFGVPGLEATRMIGRAEMAVGDLLGYADRDIRLVR